MGALEDKLSELFSGRPKRVPTHKVLGFYNGKPFKFFVRVFATGKMDILWSGKNATTLRDEDKVDSTYENISDFLADLESAGAENVRVTEHSPE